MKQIINYSCDGQGNGNCTGENSEIRVLPYGNGNLLVCHAHYNKEMEYRREENREKFPGQTYWEDAVTLKKIPHPSAYEIPSWYSLKVYSLE